YPSTGSSFVSRRGRIARRLGTGLALAMLGGCAGLPMYQPAPSQPLATIRLSPNMASQSMPLSMCDGQHCYDLKNSHGELQVPVGHHLMLFNVLVADGYLRVYSCSADLSFGQYAGVVYYADFALRAEHCV